MVLGVVVVGWGCSSLGGVLLLAPPLSKAHVHKEAGVLSGTVAALSQILLAFGGEDTPRITSLRGPFPRLPHLTLQPSQALTP